MASSSPSSIVVLLFFFIILLNFFCISSSSPTLFRSRRSLQSLGDEDHATDHPLQKPDPKKNNIKSISADSKDLSKSKSTIDNLSGLSKSPNSASTINKSSNISKSLNSTSTINKDSKLSNSTFAISETSKLFKSLNNSTSTINKLSKSINSTSTINKSSKLSKSLHNSTSRVKESTMPSKSLNNSTSTINNKSKLNKTTSAIITNKPLTKSKDPISTTSSKPLKKLDPTMSWLAEEDDDDLIDEFREFPSRLIPDIAKMSAKSKVYISRANKEMMKSFKPYVGTKYAAAAAAAAAAMLLSLPLLLLAVIFYKLRNYYSFSLQRGLVFAHAYLAIYFATLSATALFTGLEPMGFFHVASPPAYACMQALQASFYVIYLLAELVNLAMVITTTKAATATEKVAAAAQLAVGLAVGVHYYAVVFHRAAAGEPPKANWRVHTVYAACFAVICGCSRAIERKKKVYNEGGDDDCKKS